MCGLPVCDAHDEASAERSAVEVHAEVALLERICHSLVE